MVPLGVIGNRHETSCGIVDEWGEFRGKERTERGGYGRVVGVV